jgi:hypothetical protein
MPEDTPIHIHRVIVHKVDHKQYDEALISDLESPLSPEVRSFLRRHIRTNREHKNSRTATFLAKVPPKQASLRGMSDAILDDPAKFVRQSQKIAEHLFEHLSGRTSPGDLVVCLFSEGQPPGDPWLALLKMDPSDGFVGDRTKVDGQWQMVLRLVRDVLPSSDRELQKCAFILPPKLRKQRKYDLQMLDQQNRRYGVQEAVATFFSQGFLQCKIALNPAEITAKFFLETNRWLKKREAEWSEEQVERARAQLHQMIQHETVDVTDFARAVITDPKDRQAYLDFLRERGIEDFVFQPDPAQRQRLTEYAVFEGDDGLRIRIRADVVGQMLTCQQDQVTKEQIITIRTTSWEQTRGKQDPCAQPA